MTAQRTMPPAASTSSAPNLERKPYHLSVGCTSPHHRITRKLGPCWIGVGGALPQHDRILRQGNAHSTLVERGLVGRCPNGSVGPILLQRLCNCGLLSGLMFTSVCGHPAPSNPNQLHLCVNYHAGPSLHQQVQGCIALLPTQYNAQPFRHIRSSAAAATGATAM